MEDQEYDLAFSFAGEQQEYVERTARACQSLGLKVFYYKDATNDWWGKNFIREQRDIYSSKTRYFVPFISNEYLSKPVPMDEFSAAMMTAVKQGDGYILPVLMDSVKVPPDLLHPHIHYLRSADHTPEQLAEQFAKRIGVARQRGQQPAPLGQVVEEALQFRMPKIVPDDWSKYEELDRTFEYLLAQFQRGAEQLRAKGLACSVREREDGIIVRVERGGATVGGINIWRGVQMGDDRITWNTDWHSVNQSSFNGWATPKFDKDRGEAIIEIRDFAAIGRGDSDIDGPRETFFDRLWSMLIDQIER